MIEVYGHGFIKYVSDLGLPMIMSLQLLIHCFI